MNALLGRKIKMTRIFDGEGRSVPVTAIQAGPCGIVQVKTQETDGYNAIQLGFHEITKKRGPNRPRGGHLKKWNSPPWKYLREIRVETSEGFTPGGKLTADVFSKGDLVKITGISKGKGFSGGIKRHGWRGQPGSHGSMMHRKPGSIGASAAPSRVLKGHHLPGHMGARRTTVNNLTVVRVDPEHHVLYVRGAVPGAPGELVLIRQSHTAKRKKG
jgi:large subunit ribosomal protein L3